MKGQESGLEIRVEGTRVREPKGEVQELESEVRQHASAAQHMLDAIKKLGDSLGLKLTNWAVVLEVAQGYGWRERKAIELLNEALGPPEPPPAAVKHPLLCLAERAVRKIQALEETRNRLAQLAGSRMADVALSGRPLGDATREVSGCNDACPFHGEDFNGDVCGRYGHRLPCVSLSYSVIAPRRQRLLEGKGGERPMKYAREVIRVFQGKAQAEQYQEQLDLAAACEGKKLPPERVARVQAAFAALKELTPYERGLITCWFCRGCGRHMKPGDYCSCECDE